MKEETKSKLILVGVNTAIAIGTGVLSFWLGRNVGKVELSRELNDVVRQLEDMSDEGTCIAKSGAEGYVTYMPK